MWGWSRTVAEYAAAAAWTYTQSAETEPKYGEPEYWAETTAEELSADADGVRIAARDPMLREYDLAG
ncbi:hypothetical protein [Nocardia pneumoniae]|uniref:hypothetical protein n=1 Tax=Nocardia pneumoniae TaxID=228601 RepID=UPI0002DC04A9|nr:hypothetical protein [Nocardia pneumoniae]